MTKHLHQGHAPPGGTTVIALANAALSSENPLPDHDHVAGTCRRFDEDT